MDGQMMTLADTSTLNVFAQLESLSLADDVKAEIKLVMSAEIRRIEIELSMMLTDLKASFEADIEALRKAGKVLPEDHMLQPLQQVRVVDSSV